MSQVVVDGKVLNSKQLAGEACIYCRVTFGAMDLVEPPGEIPGVLFLVAHRHCKVRHDPAYKRGVARAAADRLKSPPDDGTVDVSVPTDRNTRREEFKLCRSCGWARESRRCRCS